MKRLTKQQALEIYYSGGPQTELAKKYGVAQSTISAIKQGRTWSHVTKGEPMSRSKLTDEAIQAIYLSDASGRELSQEYDISESMISRIRRGKIHEDKTEGLSREAEETGFQAKKLTEDDAREIWLAAGTRTQEELGEQFDVSRTTIWAIQTGRSWTHVTDELFNAEVGNG